MLQRMWGKGNAPPLLMGVQTCTATLEISVTISQKIRKQSTSRPSNITFGYIPEGCSIIPQGHVLNYVHSCIIHNSQNWKQLRCLSTEEWIKKMWYNYTIEYYLAVKK